MVVLAAAICTKSGKPVVSRQFRELPRSRIEALLTSFPKLIPAGSQHTTVETESVRFVYQPLDELYLLLVTNKASNILQDIESLQLFSRVTGDVLRSVSEDAVVRHAFELLGAWDEIVSLGYRESVNLLQIRSVIEMESHEEKIQEIIARNKEQEAKEELKRRAKQLELQRREAQRNARANPGYAPPTSGGFGQTYAPVPRDEPTLPSARRYDTPEPAPKAPAFKGAGMKLGAKKAKANDLLDQIAPDVAPLPVHPTQAGSQVSTPSRAPATPVPEEEIEGREPTHLSLSEHLSLTLSRDGDLVSHALSGALDLRLSQAATAKHLLVALDPASVQAEVQFKTHPNVDKALWASGKTIGLKDRTRAFPVGQALGVLKWRWAGKDETAVPLSITCWPSPTPHGTYSLTLEYELSPAFSSHILQDVIISIPLPSGAHPSFPDGAPPPGVSVSAATGALEWLVPAIGGDEESSGSIEFEAQADDADEFFPVEVAFRSEKSLCGVQVVDVKEVEGETPVPFSVDTVVDTEEYRVE